MIVERDNNNFRCTLCAHYTAKAKKKRPTLRINEEIREKGRREKSVAA